MLSSTVVRLLFLVILDSVFISSMEEYRFADENGQRQHVWQTSWAIRTRFVGGIIMTHGDDAGLMLPPCWLLYRWPSLTSSSLSSLNIWAEFNFVWHIK
ncbi:hypothetical protein L2E82_01844 [Cichorium intybus]|uniref:Uncharacterized protein n=1 Tax=Cichorium intybus TaxID=13427 RepID=A0ACB9H256_CICIN|nr:hypothetical protein L2E82_01844 [Cichorium intybus]